MKKLPYREKEETIGKRVEVVFPVPSAQDVRRRGPVPVRRNKKRNKNRIQRRV